MYFSQLPNVYVRTTSYRNNSVDPYVLAKNIFRRIAIRKDLDSALLGFSQYTILNAERPDQVSTKFYGTSKYDWVVLISNNIINLYDEWPMNEHELYNYVIRKYGSAGGIHHWVTQDVRDGKGRLVLSGNREVKENFTYMKYDGTMVPKLDLIKPISNWEHEYEQNEYKRNIYILREEYISMFLQEFSSLVAYLPNEETDPDTLAKKSLNTTQESFKSVSPRYATNIGQTSSIEFSVQQDFSSKTFSSATKTINQGDVLATGAVVAKTTTAITGKAGTSTTEVTNQYGSSTISNNTGTAGNAGNAGSNY